MERTIVQPIMPREIDLKEPQWIVVTPENKEEQLARIEKQEGELVFLAMTIPDYEVMAYNMQELKRYIAELKDVVPLRTVTYMSISFIGFSSEKITFLWSTPCINPQ